jgi:hypothetical protein
MIRAIGGLWEILLIARRYQLVERWGISIVTMWRLSAVFGLMAGAEWENAAEFSKIAASSLPRRTRRSQGNLWSN